MKQVSEADPRRRVIPESRTRRSDLPSLLRRAAQGGRVASAPSSAAAASVPPARARAMSLVSRVYADVNTKRPREYWDYEALVVNWGEQVRAERVQQSTQCAVACVMCGCGAQRWPFGAGDGGSLEHRFTFCSNRAAVGADRRALVSLPLCCRGLPTSPRRCFRAERLRGRAQDRARQVL